MTINAIYLFLEKHSKTILFGMFWFSFFGSLFTYKFAYGFGWWSAFYFALVQFVGTVEKPPLNEPYGYFIYPFATIAFSTSVFSFIILFLKSSIQERTLLVMSKEKNHIVVCGFGQNNRYYVENKLQNEPDTDIIIIDNDESNIHLKRYAHKYANISVLYGDSTKKETLEKAGVKNCRYIIVSTGSDIRNVTVAKTLDNLNVSCKIFVHHSDKNVETHIDDQAFFKNYANIDFFSYYENAARDLFLNKRSLVCNVDTVTSTQQVHLLIVGFGSLGQEVAAEAIKLGSFYNKQKLRISVIDKEERTKEEFTSTYPALFEHDIIDFRFYPFDLNSMAFYNYLQNDFDATYTVFALSDDNQTLRSLLKMCDVLKQKSFDEAWLHPLIAVRFKHQVKINLKPLFGDVFEFANTKEMASDAVILHADLDKEAKALNENYARHNGATASWENLSNFLKDSNRSAVDHWIVKQDILKRLEIKELTDIPQETKERLIDVEHRRWNIFHYMHGYKHKEASKWKTGEEPKTTYTRHKFHPCLVETKELPKLSKEHGNDYEKNDFLVYLHMEEIKNSR